ncbi:MAG: hypothetical protein CMB47_07000 [Euryarchaeota archaeon]|nr:hypothetical protein [Euryarchaeota archaeon]|tara:strand:- start:19325 stop:19957 length:633 start_codon:yes stop_codon:yes gene_type:complete
MISAIGYLWVNPFLDEFYEWGEGKWWNTKEEFLEMLDSPLSELGRIRGVESKLSDEYPQEIVKYLVERVPEWYFNGLPKDSSGVPLVKINHLSINGFYGSSINRQYSTFVSAWENNTPFPYDEVDFSEWQIDEKGRVWEESYKDYPEELKNGKGVLLCHTYYKSYVRLVDVQGVFWNALLFTAKKNKSWCKSSKISYLNWTLRNPMEVKG